MPSLRNFIGSPLNQLFNGDKDEYNSLSKVERIKWKLQQQKREVH